jgi:hypothetical protein
LLQERRPPLLASEARITELINMLYCREPAHHVAPCHPTERLEVLVAEARVPTPRIAAMLSCQANRRRDLQFNDI